MKSVINIPQKKMIRLGNLVIGASNNYRKQHHFPKGQTKRYPNESRNLPKWIRVKYHHMKRVGCDDLFICKFMSDFYGKNIADLVCKEVYKKFLADRKRGELCN